MRSRVRDGLIWNPNQWAGIMNSLIGNGLVLIALKRRDGRCRMEMHFMERRIDPEVALKLLMKTQG